MEIIYWTGSCDIDRVEALTDIENYIKKYGRLVDFKSFSGISVSFKIVIEDQNLQVLFDELKEFVKLDDFEMREPNANAERVVLFNLGFVGRKII